MMTPEVNKKPRLLVVDDEYWGCRTVKALFSRTFEVETAMSVAEARKNFALDSFDAAIVDYHMPGESGLVLVALLKAFLPKERIFLTTADDALKNMGEDRYTYMGKPYEPKKFISDVEAAVLAATSPPRPLDGTGSGPAPASSL